jgi:hypothetical protein
MMRTLEYTCAICAIFIGSHPLPLNQPQREPPGRRANAKAKSTRRCFSTGREMSSA